MVQGLDSFQATSRFLCSEDTIIRTPFCSKRIKFLMLCTNAGAGAVLCAIAAHEQQHAREPRTRCKLDQRPCRQSRGRRLMIQTGVTPLSGSKHVVSFWRKLYESFCILRLSSPVLMNKKIILTFHERPACPKSRHTGGRKGRYLGTCGPPAFTADRWRSPLPACDNVFILIA